MEWINFKEQTPVLNEESDYAQETFLVAVKAGNKMTTFPMEWRKTIIRNKVVERWEWNGKISPWEVLYWMPLPEPPNK